MLRWFGHVLQKEYSDWVKKCTEYEVELPDQEVDQRKLGERDYGKRLSGTYIEQ